MTIIALIAALLASPQLSQAQKSTIGDLKGQTTMTAKSERTGTDVDGINGLFTSRFEFPTAFLKDLNSGNPFKTIIDNKKKYYFIFKGSYI